LRWIVRALLARCRIVLFKNPLDDEIYALRVAFVAQEQGLLTVSDQNETIMGNAEFEFRCHYADSKCIASDNAKAIAMVAHRRIWHITFGMRCDRFARFGPELGLPAARWQLRHICVGFARHSKWAAMTKLSRSVNRQAKTASRIPFRRAAMAVDILED
jgi:hypothetical protein